MKIEEIWETLIFDKNKSWVIFEYGTCVVVMQHKIDTTTDAIEIMKKYGPVHAGSPAGDFRVVKSTDLKGWIVLYNHPDILNFVSPDELKLPDQIDENAVTIGLTGRNKRRLDAESLKILFIHEKG